MAQIYGMRRPAGWRWRMRALAFAVLATGAFEVPGYGIGNGYGHGTSGAVITSAGAIVAAIDSKEVNREYLSDGSSATDDRISCKVRQAGPFYVMLAGISRSTDGFDALELVEGLYRPGDSVDLFAERLAADFPSRLGALLDGVRGADRAAFEESFLGQDVLQLSLLGNDHGTLWNGPRVVMIGFRASWDAENGRVRVVAHRSSCPGDCDNSNTVYLLGLHDEAEQYVAQHRELAGDTRSVRALQLIHLEYASHPETVGGPSTVIRVTPAGAVMEQAGACGAAAWMPRVERELDDTIAAVENVVVREDIAQFSKRGSEVRTDAIHATVRVVAGNEAYEWSDGFEGLPQPWCSGELSTMLRVTRHILAEGLGTPSQGAAMSGGATVMLSFHGSTAQHFWQLVVDSRTYPLAFDGRAWFSQETGKLLRLQWQTTDLNLPASAGIARIEWDESFGTSEIAGRTFLTPDKATYRVSYVRRADRTDWTETRFSDFRRYGATENVRYEEAAIR